jgi:hypothetical protein
MKTTRVLFPAAFCLASALANTPVAAQSSPLVPGRITAAIGTGYGGATLSCSGCSLNRQSSLAVVLRVGAAVAPNLSLGIEATGWSKDYHTLTDHGTTQLGSADLVAQLYPAENAGFYYKAGGGFSAIRNDITRAGIGRTRIATNTLDLVAGVGWDLPATRNISLTPFVDLHHAPKRNAKVNGASSGQQIGATLLHIGLAATWR